MAGLLIDINRTITGGIDTLAGGIVGISSTPLVMGKDVTSLPVWVSSTEITPLRQATNKRWFASSRAMATLGLHCVTGQLATSSRFSRSTTETWFLALLFTYIFDVDFSNAMASRVSPSILRSANFSPAVVSMMLSIEYVS